VEGVSEDHKKRIDAAFDLANASGQLSGAIAVIGNQQTQIEALHEHIKTLHRILDGALQRSTKESEALQQMQAEVERLRVCVDRVSAHNAVAETVGRQADGMEAYTNTSLV